MRIRCRRIAAGLMALALILCLSPRQGQAALTGVYLTAVNEQVMPLSSETMPFLSNGILYVPHTIFQGTDIGVNYGRNYGMRLALLFTPQADLRFDLERQITYDKQGKQYTGYAIEKGEYIFFPLDLICSYFGLTWSFNPTDTAPLLRIKNSQALLDDESFISAAAGLMYDRYSAYERLIEEQNQPEEEPPPPLQAAEGQKLHLIARSTGAEDTQALLSYLEAGEARATILFTAEQLLEGDLVRAAVAAGHSVALLAQGETERSVSQEIDTGRERLWQAACLWLDLVWYEGEAEVTDLLEDKGCVRVTAELDRRETGLTSQSAAQSLLGTIGRYRRDVTIYLGEDSRCLGGIVTLLGDLGEAGYHLCAWRMGV